MTIEITYTQARETLARLLDKVTQDREIVIIKRRGQADIGGVGDKNVFSVFSLRNT